MRRSLYCLFIAILLGSLCACGQSGKLYLPDKHHETDTQSSVH